MIKSFRIILFPLCLLMTFSQLEGNIPKWFIAIKKKSDCLFQSLDDYHAFLPPQKMFYADPMLFKKDSTNYLFFEEYDYKKGTIAYVTIDKDLNTSPVTRVLELDVHLSFPFIFEEGESVYMVPETIGWSEVALYKAMNFPTEWTKVRTLVQGADFSDPIIFRHGEYVWLFVSTCVSRLNIYYAPDLNSPFRPHPINGAFKDGRNAGGVFYQDGYLIRPVMDCSKIYGGSIIFKRILELSPTTFKEEVIGHIEPTWAPGLNGTHTFNVNEDIVVYDGRRSIPISEDGLYSSSHE